MTKQPEIKAGQRWKHGGTLNVSEVIFADSKTVLIERCSDEHRTWFYPGDFTRGYSLVPESKLRPITAADIMKMLAEHNVIYSRNKAKGCGKWIIVHAPEYLDVDLENTEISHNPFVTNPVIVGPMVMDEVGE
jgi:hypothetical protein